MWLAPSTPRLHADPSPRQHFGVAAVPDFTNTKAVKMLKVRRRQKRAELYIVQKTNGEPIPRGILLTCLFLSWQAIAADS